MPSLRSSGTAYSKDAGPRVPGRILEQAHAVRAGLGLVNDLWLLRREHYPEYLSEHVGLSAE